MYSQSFSHSCLGHFVKVTISKTPASTFGMPNVQPHFNISTSSAYQTTITVQKWLENHSACSSRNIFFCSVLSFLILKYGPHNFRSQFSFSDSSQTQPNLGGYFVHYITLINQVMLWQLGSEHHDQEKSFNNSLVPHSQSAVLQVHQPYMSIRFASGRWFVMKANGVSKKHLGYFATTFRLTHKI